MLICIYLFSEKKPVESLITETNLIAQSQNKFISVPFILSQNVSKKFDNSRWTNLIRH